MTIAIIGAMEEEIEWLRSRLEDERKEETAEGAYFVGKLGGREIVLHQCGVGKVNAALAAALLIERRRPELVINTGVAGGIGRGLRIGDVVFAAELAYSDVEASAFRYEYGQVPRMPARYAAPDGFTELARKLIAARGPEGRLFTGLITTADSFIGRQEAADHIRARFPESLATDMESAAIAQTAFRLGVPFLAVRAISDIAGDESSEVFPSHLDLAATHAAEAVLEWLDLYNPAVQAGV